MSTEVKTSDPAEIQQVVGKVSMLRKELEPMGYASFLAGLDDNVDDKTLMGRLVEIGPNSDQGEKAPTANEFKAIVAASRYVGDQHRAVLLSRLRDHTNNQSSPYNMMAHEALASIDPASARVLEAHRKTQLEKHRAEAGRRTYGCCSGHDF